MNTLLHINGPKLGRTKYTLAIHVKQTSLFGKKLSFAYSTNSEKDVNIVICKFKSYSICPAGQAQLDLYFWLNLKVFRLQLSINRMACLLKEV